MTVVYEWDVETVSVRDTEDHEADECVDHAHQTSYAECLKFIERNTAGDGYKFIIVIVRDDDEGRSWAYIDEDGLPEFFMDAMGDERRKVPARFHSEFSKT